MDTISEMKIKAEFEGRQYIEGRWNLTINGAPNKTVIVRLRPGYSAKDHLFDKVLAAIDARLQKKSSWSHTPALKQGLWNARKGCGCDAAMSIIIDGREV